MQHRIEQLDDRRMLVVTTAGDASFDGFCRLITELLQAPYVELDYPVIIDNRRLNLKSLERSEAESLADLLAQHMDKLAHVRHALVAGDVVSFGISRLFELRASSFHNLPMQVFLDYDEALAWVGRPS